MFNETPDLWEFGPKPWRVLLAAAVTVGVSLSILLGGGPIRYPLAVFGFVGAAFQSAVGLLPRPQFRADGEGVSIRPITAWRYRVRLQWEDIERIDIQRSTMSVHTSHDARFLRDELRPKYQVLLQLAGVGPDDASSALHRLSGGRFG